MNMEIQNEQYTLLPCSGRKILGIPRGHIYEIRDKQGNKLGFEKKETAFEKYGQDNSIAIFLVPILYAIHVMQTSWEEWNN